MSGSPQTISRRQLLKAGAAASAIGTFTIVPRHVLGGAGYVAPSETFGGALIGVGGQGPQTFRAMSEGLNVVKQAECDVKFLDRADNKTIYTDFRRVLDRKDIELVAIATPPHWHVLIAIAAAQAGKDVLGEKPATRTIAEGRALVDAFRRYGRIFQVGTFGRFKAARDPERRATHKLMRSGLLTKCDAVVHQRGNFKVKEWSGDPLAKPAAVPKNLDWDMYCGPAPLKPFTPTRYGGTHRGWWDYEGGGLADMGQHMLDPVSWTWGKDDTSPVEIESHAPPAHPECTGMWGWVELKYADGLTLVVESGEWGERYSRKQPKGISVNDLSAEDQKRLAAMPDPEPLVTFAEAVKTRKQPGGHAEAAHRSAAIMHLANISIRLGRKIHYDPVKEQAIGDEEANRLINPPMRAPWHL